MSAFPTLSILALVVATTFSVNVQAQASEASALSTLPIGALSEGASTIVGIGAYLTVVAVQASAEGSTWVLERASDGARASLKLAGKASCAVGASVAVTSVAAGAVLSVAGQAIAFIPNEIGAALLHNERVTP